MLYGLITLISFTLYLINVEFVKKFLHIQITAQTFNNLQNGIIFALTIYILIDGLKSKWSSSLKKSSSYINLFEFINFELYIAIREIQEKNLIGLKNNSSAKLNLTINVTELRTIHEFISKQNLSDEASIISDIINLTQNSNEYNTLLEKLLIIKSKITLLIPNTSI